MEMSKKTMDESKFEINVDTTISEAIAILKLNANSIAYSGEAKKFHQENPNSLNLFKKSYNPYQEAVALYKEALNINEWLNVKSPKNVHWTLKEVFFNMTDQEKLSLFQKRIDKHTPSIFDELLRAWWTNRY